ncbi:nuclear transport factor 2 family protein [Streptomyces longisporoflavus]|uniref:Nuclear transport factor 2 family protein n=1 Tax=Streptomyces longisporoflavus TaxID=28044 RepID=A0ABW7QZT3_9ACTN
MSVPIDQLTDPAVRTLLIALNANDRAAFRAALTEDATMSDDGSERDVDDWSEREIFSSNGQIDVESEQDGGLSLVADYRNDTWGAMRTAWRFTVADGKVSRFETGQA